MAALSILQGVKECVISQKESRWRINESEYDSWRLPVFVHFIRFKELMFSWTEDWYEVYVNDNEIVFGPCLTINNGFKELIFSQTVDWCWVKEKEYDV